jgi:tryptophan 2,3-dioxygenase
LVQQWLERTPGLEADGFNFWGKYKQAVENLLAKQRKTAEVRTETNIYSILNYKLNIQGDFFLNLV